MEEIQPPAVQPDLKPVKVSYLKFESDAGTGWARSLSPAQVADLVDVAGELAKVFPVVRERRVTEKQFKAKLNRLGIEQEANEAVVRVVGYTSGLVTPYIIWWSWTYVYNFTRACTMADRTEEDAKFETAMRMGITTMRLNERLARRDVSYLVNLFLTRKSREMEGAIKWQTALGAMNGGSKAQELYFKHVASSEDTGTRAGEIDPWNKSEAELQAEIIKMRKLVGETPEEIEAEIDNANTSVE